VGGLDSQVLAERVAAVERHLRRVTARLPEEAEHLGRDADASDAVVLHLWQAVQIVIDVAVSLCVGLGRGAPPTYADAFRSLHDAEVIGGELAARLVGAAGFRNVLVHAYEEIDLQRVHAAASDGPDDLRAFLAIVRDILPGPT
jgi:uncharacterized protein YutE (UPF0331/DUF86 family)